MSDVTRPNNNSHALVSANACGCCEGIAVRTARAIANRPALAALKYRRGVQATFLESLQARLATFTLPVDEMARGSARAPLREMLTTRNLGDASIALFDAWATVADVISFYQERLANEGFLRTAEDAKSLHEMSRLVGYEPRPGVSATAHLAFEVEDPRAAGSGTLSGPTPSVSPEVNIPAGTKAKSTPAPGGVEESQTFETSHDLLASAEWNAIRPRMTRPHRLTGESLLDVSELHFQGLGLRIRPGDHLAIEYGPERAEMRRITGVVELSNSQTTQVFLELDDFSRQLVFANVIAAIANYQVSAMVGTTVGSQGGSSAPVAQDAIANSFALITTEFIKTLRTMLDSGKSLEEIDTEIEQYSCKLLSGNQLFDALAGTRTGVGVNEPANLTSLLNPASVKTYFDFTVESNLKVYQAADEALAAIAAKYSSPENVSQASAVIKSKVAALFEPVAQEVRRFEYSVEPTLGTTATPLTSFYLAEGAAAEQISTLDLALHLLGPPSGSVPGMLDADPNYIKTDEGIFRKVGQSHDSEALISALHKFQIDSFDGYLLGQWKQSAAADSQQSTIVGEFLVRRTENPESSYSFVPQEEFHYVRVNHAQDELTYLQLELSGPPGNSLAGVRFRIQGLGKTRKLGRLRCLADDFVLTSPSNGIQILRYRGAATDNVVAFSAALKLVVYDPGDEPGSVSVLVEGFVEEIPERTSHEGCVAAAVIEFRSIDGLRRTNPAFTLARELAEFSRTTTLDEASESFLAKLWPGPESGAAAERSKSLYGDRGLMIALRAEPHLSKAFNVIDAALSDLGVDSAFWKLRFAELRSALKDVYEEMRNDGAAPNPLGRLELPASLKREGLATFVDAMASPSAADALRKRADGNVHLLKIIDDAHEAIKRFQSSAAWREVRTTEAAASLIEREYLRIQNVVRQLSDAGRGVANALIAVMNKYRMAFTTRVLDSANTCLKILEAPSGSPVSLSLGHLKELVSECEKLASVMRDVKTQYVCLPADAAPVAAAAAPPSVNTADCDCEIPGEVDSTKNNLHALSLRCQVAMLQRQIFGEAKPATAGGPRNLSEGASAISGRGAEALGKAVGIASALVTRVTKQDAAVNLGHRPDVTVATVATLLQSYLRESYRTQRNSFTLLQMLDTRSDLIAQLFRSLNSQQRALFYEFLKQESIGSPVFKPKVYIFRASANVFGWSAPPTSPEFDEHLKEIVSNRSLRKKIAKKLAEMYTLGVPKVDEAERQIFLDGSFPLTVPSAPIALLMGGEGDYVPIYVKSAILHPRTAYGIRGNATRLILAAEWWSGRPAVFDQALFVDVMRRTRILCDAELLELAEAPEPPHLPPGYFIECDAVIPGLDVGRHVIVEGVKTLAESGEAATPVRQLLQIAKVEHDIDTNLFGDRYRTRLVFDRPLDGELRRDSVKIYANVVEATHGESQFEVVGGGDAARSFQQFVLRRQEMSQLPAPTPTGVEPVAKVHVNDVEWLLRPDLLRSAPDSQHYLLARDDVQRAAIRFGDGFEGARIPTGIENVRATYRTGLGRKGNVGAGQIDQLLGAPLGVKKVLNPLAAQGGADPDSVRLMRRRTPIAVLAMDRLVTLADYADFARNFAGVGKASAVQERGVVHVTLAGLDAEPFDLSGPIVRNLRHAMSLYGDPTQRVELHNREASLLILAANVRIDPRRQWVRVEPQLRRALLERFSYDNAELGKDVLLSDAISALHSVEGVQYVDVDLFDRVAQDEIASLSGRLTELKRLPRVHVSGECWGDGNHTSREPAAGILNSADRATEHSEPRDAADRDFHAAQLCYLPPEIAGALVLEQLA